MNVVNGPATSSPLPQSTRAPDLSATGIIPTSHSLDMLTAQGIKVLGGAAIGTAYVIKPESGSTSIKEKTPSLGVEHELARAQRALHAAAEEFQLLGDRINSADAQRIFEANKRMAQDPFNIRTIEQILKSCSATAEEAISQHFEGVAAKFKALSDQKFAELADDAIQVRDAACHYLSNETSGELKLSHETVVVAHSLNPRDLIVLNESGKVKALILASAGKRSHITIVAKSMGIPLVSRLDATTSISTGDTVLVNGDTGEITINPDLPTIKKFITYIADRSVIGDGLKLDEHPPQTRDGQIWTIRGTLGNIKDLPKVIASGVAGVGLFRTEELFLGDQGMIPEDEQFEIYCEVIKAFPNHPVTIRTFDLGADKWSPVLGKPPDEKNPKLGNRGIRLCFTEMIDDFRAQARAIIRAQYKHGNARVMFPMVNDLEEFRQAKALILGEMDKLVQEGVISHRIELPFGPMIETPAAVLMVKSILAEADFICIGSNDLTQYTLAIDREPTVGSPHEPVEHHPAVIKMLHKIAKAARKANKPLSLCGDMAGDTLYTPCLSGLGITDVSMVPGDAPKVNFALSCLNSVACKSMVEDARSMASAKDALQTMQKFLSKITAEQNAVRARSQQEQ